METIKMFIVLKDKGIEKKEYLVVSRATATVISGLMSEENSSSKLSEIFNNLTDVNGNVHNIEFENVESFEFKL